MARRTGFPQEVKELVLARSSGMCEAMLSGCTFQASEIHHRRTRGMGGTRRPDTNYASNALHLCSSCHEWVTRNPAPSRDKGWVVRQTFAPADVPVWWRRRRWVLLDDLGGLDTPPKDGAA